MEIRILLTFVLAVSTLTGTANADVHVIGEMRRMFTARDIGANVDLREINKEPHLYALGPLAGLKGEITVLDGQVYTSRSNGEKPVVTIDPNVKSVFLVYSSVAAWRSVNIPETVVNEKDLAQFVESQIPKNTRSAFRVEGIAETARYHIQNYQGNPEELTHEAHDAAKVFIDFTNAPVHLVGFFTNREGDGGSFVHMGQTTHIHIISRDRMHMGHLESIKLGPGARLLLPKN
jgi:alpha-acetolactate decarboxylase